MAGGDLGHSRRRVRAARLQRSDEERALPDHVAGQHLRQVVASHPANLRQGDEGRQLADEGRPWYRAARHQDDNDRYGA